MLRSSWDCAHSPRTPTFSPSKQWGGACGLIRDMPSDYAQIVEIVGTPKFEEFVKGLEVEGVGVGSTNDASATRCPHLSR